MSNAVLRVVYAVVGVVLSANAVASSNDPAWRADAEYLSRQIAARHKNAFFHTTQQSFDAATQALMDAVPALADHEVVVRMIQLVASIGDGHTTLSGYPFSRYPLRLYWFDDGLYVTEATAEQRDVLGSRLLAIDDHPIEAVTSAIATMVSHENEPWLAPEPPPISFFQRSFKRLVSPLIRDLPRFDSSALTVLSPIAYS